MEILKLVLVLMLTYFTGGVSGNFFVCNEAEDCAAPESSCTDNFCQCPIGKTLTADGTKCLDVVLSYGGSCTDDVQCAPLLGKNICKSGACECDTGYRYHHGNCIKSAGLGEFCEKNEDCFVSPDLLAMVCTDSKCTCNVDYYPRGQFDCRPLVKEYGGACAMDSDCQGLEGAKCTNNGCAQTTEPDIPSKKEIFERQDDHHQKNTIADDCNTNEDCVGGDPNSYCSPIIKKCVCKKGYFLSSGTCYGELGMNIECTANSDCKTTPRLCENGMCICAKTHYYKPALDGCSKAGYKSNDKIVCNNDLGCNVMGPLASCVKETDLDSYCICNFGSELNEHFICTRSTECEAECAENSDCTIINSICDKVNGNCICPDGYRLDLDENICTPNLGSKCDDTLACLLEHSICEELDEEENDDDKKCACQENYVQIDELTCLKSASIHEDCTHSLQCTRSNTECKQGKCVCINNHLEVGDLCIMAKEMGDYCTNVEQCQKTLSKDVLCRNSKCQCPSGYKVSEDKKGCLPK
nr:latent-transforming growth factor beta-binding protein 1-like [Onthophagus taurus]